YFYEKQGDTPHIDNLDTGRFYSDGTVTVEDGVGFTNSGTVEVRSGIFSIANDYTQGSGTTTVDSGAVLQAGGIVNIKGGMRFGWTPARGASMDACWRCGLVSQDRAQTVRNHCPRRDHHCDRPATSGCPRFRPR